MGWLSGIFGSKSDPLSSLDPKLREYIEKESPLKYTPSKPAPPPPPPPRTPSQAESQSGDKVTAGDAAKPVVPAASLYQDGRYAHLWKTYRPLAEIEEETASDHDKMMSVFEAFKERKAMLGRAAMENCIMQQEEWTNCMRNGSWEDQMVMCKYQVRRFERCYLMQTRFLKALGYGSDLYRPPEVDEDIQMHADALFQRMLEHEAAVEHAKQHGTAMPVFQVHLPGTSSSTPPPELPKAIRDKLDDMPETERAAEEAAIRADLHVKSAMAADIGKIWEKQREERQARINAGEASYWDTITSFFSSSKYDGKGGQEKK
ncbi:hypothetical protein CDD82_2989 [Ophiocordyceps australis]|uniref:Autophagy-related protein 6 n=1 Tax=Ophiocordyceps australis TaxID=1399860 RepID=A0A2C5ZQ50_9HYPO|nr:hypothetical protein CDD82_2989 [Ophiocordyceps australis]